jgi:purine-binding chemotaxis protein CheW
MMTTTCQLCTFSIDDTLYGIQAELVQEVIRYQEMTRTPLAHSCVAGLINLRGQIVTAIDLRERLGIAPRMDHHIPMNVVIRSEDGAVSLLVDQIGDIVQVDANLYETPPDTLLGPARDLVLGAYKLDGQLLLLLNATESVQVAAA